jgi:catechol 2,3-dioxygenase-like lactoylglutathione lyase family enzyme
MGFHHIAVAARDMDATHHFYTEAMGFQLVKAVVAATDAPGGWAKHLFYDTGNGQLIAFWDLHDPRVEPGFEAGLSKAMGVPHFVNHLAFAADSLDDLEARKQRLLDNGYDVAEIDHGWCTSIYADDPNGTLVEFCVTTAAFTAVDHEQAAAAIAAEAPPLEPSPMPQFFRAPARRAEPAPA